MSSQWNESFCSNVSSNSVTLDYWRLEEEYSTHGMIVAAFLLLFILLGLPWNSLVLITIIKEKLYRQPTIILLLVLVLADIFILIGPAPIIMITGFSREYGAGLKSDKARCMACRFEFAFTSLVPMYGSFFSIALMTVDRFVYIYKPLQYDRLVTPQAMWVAVVVVGIVTVAIGLTLLLVPGEPSFYPEILSCAVDLKPALSVLAVIGAASLVVIIVCNVGFSYIVLKNIKAVYTKGNFIDEAWKRTQISIRHKKECRLYLMLFFLLLTCSISWVPILSVIIDYTVRNGFQFKLAYISFSVILFYSQAILVPFVETMIIVDVRKPLIDLITCGLLKRRKDKTIHKEEANHNKENSKEHRSNQLILLTLFEAAFMNLETSESETV